MIVRRAIVSAAIFLGACNVSVFAQPPAASTPSSSARQPLFDFDESQIKFNLHTLMALLRDKQHEGWVLAAYPDPKTHRPLIGAGFSLDVDAVDHPQRDPLNARQFVEPSSAQLWQAAGLAPERLDSILAKFERDSAKWEGKRRRKLRIRTLPSQISEQDATRLLRISAIQAVSNARAYCRNFDDLTASQQLGLSQLVFQMGVNLEGFAQFLAALNGDPLPERATPVADSAIEAASAPTAPRLVPAVAITTTAPDAPLAQVDQWKTVQATLIDSQWARLYSTRAATVIAMFDPHYSQNPAESQLQVDTALKPVAVHRRGSHAAALRNASLEKKVTRKPHGRSAGKSAARSKRKRT